MGFSNCGIALAVLYGLCQCYRDVFATIQFGQRYVDYTLLVKCVSGYGFGGSAIALFGRVGGGIFTKAADVGADLSGKVISLGDGKMLDEDSPYNPAVMEDNVGDSEFSLIVYLSVSGGARGVEAKVLRVIRIGSSACEKRLGSPLTSANVYSCVLFGVWAGTIIGFLTKYFTLHSYKPTRKVARACETGAATSIIYGIALGYLSPIIPVGLIAGAIYFCFKTMGLYGVAVCSLGMLSTLASCLTIDVYGPITNNAGRVAEMSEFPLSVRDKTDALDVAGNTTAAICKGFAISSTDFVSVALTGAFVVQVSVAQKEEHKLINNGVNLMSAVVLTFLIFGANIPFWFSALTMKSVGQAANDMVREVGRQWAEIPGLREMASMDFD